jgi:hypothetical protein
MASPIKEPAVHFPITSFVQAVTALDADDRRTTVEEKPRKLRSVLTFALMR